MTKLSIFCNMLARSLNQRPAAAQALGQMSPGAERYGKSAEPSGPDGGCHPDANALWSVRTMANAGTIEIQSHGETIRGDYVVDHDGVVRLRSDIGEKGTHGATRRGDP